ncbi:MAG: MlaA family lipoprotein [Gammaproteobacteria bacterium]
MNKQQRGVSALKAIALGVLLTFASGCATTRSDPDKDPIEPVNRVFFDVNEKLDKYLMKPVAQGYQKVTPKRVRKSVTNFFDNLFYPNVILNDFLQAKFTQGFRDLARLFVNTTIGIGGLFDRATPAGLVRHREDLGQTFATWGMGQGSYLVIPLLGPSTARDVTDVAPSTFLNALFYIESVATFPIAALSVINERANLLEATEIRDEAALDSYTFTREAFLQRRKDLIYDGNPPVEEFEDFFEEGTEPDTTE